MKRLFVTVLEGDSPETALPLIATEDARIVAAVKRELLARFNSADIGSPTPFRLQEAKTTEVVQGVEE
jgi:hypothetical protein